MKKRHLAAALVLPLVFTPPAGAQGPADGRSDFRMNSGSPAGRIADARSPYLPLGNGGSGVSLSRTPIVQQDGSAVFRNTLVGSLTVSRGVRFGVGLIEVTRMSNRDPALRRVDPMGDTRGDRHRDRIAAIGLSIDF